MLQLLRLAIWWALSSAYPLPMNFEGEQADLRAVAVDKDQFVFGSDLGEGGCRCDEVRQLDGGVRLLAAAQECVAP
jgi:hypothetical protein